MRIKSSMISAAVASETGNGNPFRILSVLR